MTSDTRYPPIGDYALIGDCHTAALVSRTGGIDWCCLPRFDSGTTFGRLLDWDRGGYWSLQPVGAFESRRRYVPNTMVLETIYATDSGECRVLEGFATREGGRDEPLRQIFRVVEGLEGVVELVSEVVPRFDFGALRPLLRRVETGVYTAIGGDDGIVIRGDFDFERHNRHELAARATVRAGERRFMTLTFMSPATIDWNPPTSEERAVLDGRIDFTLEWWSGWAKELKYGGAYADTVIRSALVLKALTYAPSGAMVAAPTTSLPEREDGSWTWDYRYSWVRDSAFAVRSLAELGGGMREAEAFRRFIERSAAAMEEQLQVLFGVEGEHLRRLQEVEIDWLEGWRGAQPVRIGNAAAFQVQHDTVGYLLALAWDWAERGWEPDEVYRTFLQSMVDAICKRWDMPDRGIWELRGEPRHYVHSKIMAWSAIDLGLRLGDRFDFGAESRARWEQSKSDIRAQVESEGYDGAKGIYQGAYESVLPDAALLLIPTTGYLDWTDPRMIRTTDALRDALGYDGLIRRFAQPDGEPEEGAFVPACFWLAQCLSRQGRRAEAIDVFEGTLEAANDLGLLSEVYDPIPRQMRGNYPQALSHLTLISAAVALDGG